MPRSGQDSQEERYRLSIEERFWSRVWRCTHHHPCKKCCWPWRDVDLTKKLWWAWQKYPAFSDPRFLSGRATPAYRVAYILTNGILLISRLAICHQCDFAPCCNPSHIRPGTSTDNGRDRRGKKRNGEGRHHVILPDGRVLSPIEAVRERDAIYAASARRQTSPVLPYKGPPEMQHSLGNFDAVQAGGKIRRHRTEQRISLKILAQRCGISPITLTNIEHGRYIMTIKHLVTIARVLELDVKYILFGNDIGAQKYDVAGHPIP